MYKRRNGNKGITLISLGIVITILLIITSTIILSANDRYKSEKLDKLANDLQLLTEKTGMYYLNNKQYPTMGSQITITINEENVYTYKIDLSKMDGLTLNYGKGDGEDYYTIDTSTGIVYYKNGIEGIYNLTQAEATDGIKVVKITKQPEWQKVREGQSATLSVEVEIPDGISVSYEWWSTDSYNDAGTKISEETDKTLIIENVTVDDVKYYYCKINNITNNITIKSDVVKLELRDYIDYKIFGNTIEGVSVGDLVTDKTDSNYGKYKIPVKVSSKNIADLTRFGIVNNAILERHENKLISTVQGTNAKFSMPIYVKKNTQYTFKFKFKCPAITGYFGLSNQNSSPDKWEFGTGNWKQYEAYAESSWEKSFNSGDSEVVYFKGYYLYTYTEPLVFEFYDIQLEEGYSATQYEPYIEPVTTNIYLNEPLRNLEGKADFIDFNNQKVVRYIKEENGELSLIEDGPKEMSIQLPKIPEIDGVTGVITVDTIIEPSKIEAN